MSTKYSLHVNYTYRSVSVVGLASTSNYQYVVLGSIGQIYELVAMRA